MTIWHPASWSLPSTSYRQTCFCTRELGIPVSTRSSISEDTMANQLRDNGPTVRCFREPSSMPAPQPTGSRLSEAPCLDSSTSGEGFS